MPSGLPAIFSAELGFLLGIERGMGRQDAIYSKRII